MKSIKQCMGLIGFLLWMFTLPAAAQPLVTINVTDAEVRDVLTSLATVGQVNLVADDSVSGKITIKLDQVPLDTALDLITRAKGLVYSKVNQVIVVASGEKMGAGFGSVHILPLQYALAPEAVSVLAVAVGGDDKRLAVDTATNSIIFRGHPAEVQQLREVLAKLDVPHQQVALEAQVISIHKSAAKDLGVEWKWEMTPYMPEYSKNTTAGSTTSAIRSDYKGGVIQYGRAPSGLPYQFNFQAKINALIADGKASLLAKPNITTVNGKQARILIGDRIPVLKESIVEGKVSTSIEYVDAGIKLTYTPQVNADGRITAKIHTEVSTPVLVPELKAYRITTREAETQVQMKDSQTMVIGGLIAKDQANGKTAVPFLSKLPLLGKLFQSSHSSQNETEVLIFLTAHVVNP